MMGQMWGVLRAQRRTPLPYLGIRGGFLEEVTQKLKLTKQVEMGQVAECLYVCGVGGRASAKRVFQEEEVAGQQRGGEKHLVALAGHRTELDLATDSGRGSHQLMSLLAPLGLPVGALEGLNPQATMGQRPARAARHPL